MRSPGCEVAGFVIVVGAPGRGTVPIDEALLRTTVGADKSV